MILDVSRLSRTAASNILLIKVLLMKDSVKKRELLSVYFSAYLATSMPL